MQVPLGRRHSQSQSAVDKCSRPQQPGQDTQLDDSYQSDDVDAHRVEV